MRRSVLIWAGWLTAAVAATLTGLGAVSIIGSGITGGSGDVYTEERVARDLASPAGPAPTQVSTPAATPRSSGPARRPLAGPGGTVVAECTGGQVRLVSWIPAQGFHVSEVERGPDDEAEVTFEKADSEVEVEVWCVGDEPTARWQHHGEG